MGHICLKWVLNKKKEIKMKMKKKKKERGAGGRATRPRKGGRSEGGQCGSTKKNRTGPPSCNEKKRKKEKEKKGKEKKTVGRERKRRERKKKEKRGVYLHSSLIFVNQTIIKEDLLPSQHILMCERMKHIS